MLVREFLAKTKTVILPQPTFSPDLASADFFLLLKLKTPMTGKRFATIEKIETGAVDTYHTARSRSVAGIGIIDGISVLYLRGLL